MSRPQVLLVVVSTLLTGARGACPHLEPGAVTWSTAWPHHSMPGADDQVTIASGSSVILDVSPPCLSSITVETGAKLIWGDVDELTLCTSYILIHGEFHLGSDDCRFTKKANIQLFGESNSTLSVQGFGRKFMGVAAGGTVEIHGEDKPSWTKLIKTVNPAIDTCGTVFDFQTSSHVSESGRGLYAAAFNLDGSLFDFGVFRTGDNVDSDAARFKTFIESVPDNKVLAVALQGELGAGEWNDTYTALEVVGGLSPSAIRDVNGREAYAFVTYTGNNALTEEKHVTNPDSKEYVETGYLKLAFNSLQLRVNSKVFLNPNTRRGVDFKVLTDEVARPCIEVNADVSKWRAGDVVVVASTDFDWKQAEEMTVRDCPTCAPNQICFTEPFTYMHYGEVTYGVDERAEVGLLARNIVIEGVMQETCTANDDIDQTMCDRFGYDTFGGHFKVTKGFTAAHVQGVELRNMGQQRNLGTYPLHFHMCDDVDGNWFRSNSVHHSTRCVTIHGTDGAEVSDNVCYLHLGHGIFLEDSAEQRNIIQGNLVLGTMHGSHLLSDMKKEWCSSQLRPFCDALSSFWITHPNNRFLDNVAAGGDNVGYWILASKFPLGPSFDRQQIRGLVNESTAMETPLLEFRNNTAHSYEERGMRIDHRISHGETNMGVEVPENGVIGATISHTPRLTPGDRSSNFAHSNLHGFTAYKNRFQNVWTKAGIVIMNNFTLADSPRGLIMASAKFGTYGKITGSMFVGETDNIGLPSGPFGRSVANQRNEPLQGLQFYQGPGVATHTFFNQYQKKTSGNLVRNAGAISVRRNNPYPPKANSQVEAIKFGFCDGTEGNRAFNGAPNRAHFSNRDGNRQINFHDVDGSVTGTAGTQVVPNSRFHTTRRCSYRAGWNWAVCPYGYGKLQFDGDGVLQTQDKNYPMSMRRDDRPDDPFALEGEKGNNYLLIKGKSYTVYFNGTAPTNLKISPRNLARGDFIRVGICYTKDTTSLTLSGGFGNINNRRSSQQAISVTSLADLDSDTTGRAYFHDQDTGLLFVKIQSDSDRVEHEACPGFRCPALKITRNDGSDETPDCAADAYNGKYNVEEDAAVDRPTASDTCDKTTSEGYGAEVEDNFFSSSQQAVQCPVAPTQPGRSTPTLVGCFRDTFFRDLPNNFIKLPMSMTVEFCQDRCYQHGYTYAGVQNGNECWCGHLYGGYGESSACTKPCTGNKDQICGGRSANTIYTSGLAIPPTQTPCGPANTGVMIDGDCYYVTSGKYSFLGAEGQCRSLGGHLATINNEVTQFEVERYLRQKQTTVWFGLNDGVTNLQYSFMDGTPLGSYDNFRPGQGQQTGAHGVVLMGNSVQMWDDRGFGESLHALCQLTTTPTTPVACGHNNYGQRLGNGECYAIISAGRARYDDARFACYTRRGVVADATHPAALADIKDHVYRFGNPFMDYLVEKDGDTYFELENSKLYTKIAGGKTMSGGIVCKIETLDATTPCSTGWESDQNGNCYLYLNKNARYDFFTKLCIQGDSNVLSIENEAQNALVRDLAVAGGKNAVVFLGLQFNAETASFSWADGSTFVYENWREGHGISNVVNGGECAALQATTSSTVASWRNRVCTKSAKVVCKAPAIV